MQPKIINRIETRLAQDFLRLNPATVVIEAGRGLLAASPVKVGLAFALLAAASAVLAIFARRGLASAERAG